MKTFPRLGKKVAAFRREPYSKEPELAVLSRAVPLDSAFYVERSPIETNCYDAILKTGALIRIKGSKQMGKTSLVLRILHWASQQGCRSALLDFEAPEASVLQDLDACLQWIGQQVTQNLHLPDRLAEYWDDLFGSTISCKSYFEEYLLVQTPQPLVLALDNVDRLFAYPNVADEVFGLLRAWHEESKNRPVWQRLRLVVSHATEVYIPLNIHKSPFNVGMPIELNGLTADQIQDLARRYGLDWSAQATESLLELLGGHPYLVQTTLQYLQQDNISLEQLLQAAVVHPIYQDHLQQQWQTVKQDPALAEAFYWVVQASAPAELEPTQALKLQSLGLVTLHGAQATPSCTLYAQYFGDRLRQDETA